MSLVIFIDGQFYDEKEAKVSVLDHGYLYGKKLLFPLIRATEVLKFLLQVILLLLSVNR